ncbi:MAG: metallophosphoesterase [Pseudomonadota bacterium]
MLMRTFVVPRALRFHLLLCLLIGAAQPVYGDLPVLTTDAPVYVVGDVHGAYQSLFELLHSNGLIDEAGNWQAEDSILVSVGDLLDRGPGSRAVMDLFMNLSVQAPQEGGQVIVLMGNHEMMNLLSEYRDVSEAEIAAFSDLTGYARAMSRQGAYGQWLEQLPLVVRVNDWLLMHGGLTARMAMQLNQVNTRAQQALEQLRRYGEAQVSDGLLASGTSYIDHALASDTASPSIQQAASEPALGGQGPAWYRGNSGCHPLIERENIAEVLSITGARGIVVGHTPTPAREVTSRFGGRVLAVDTGMLASTYRGAPRLLRLQGDKRHVFGLGGLQAPIVEDTLQTVGQPTPLKTGKSKRSWAAFLLDQHLGLQMTVPPSLATEAGDFPQNILSEAGRQERGWARPNYCGDASDFDLVRIFDALIGKLDRSANDLGYDPRSWSIKLTNHAATFGNHARVPTYAAPARAPFVPPQLREELASLTQSAVQEVVGGLLSKRQVRSLLKRRDKILQWEAER